MPPHQAASQHLPGLTRWKWQIGLGLFAGIRRDWTYNPQTQNRLDKVFWTNVPHSGLNAGGCTSRLKTDLCGGVLAPETRPPLPTNTIPSWIRLNGLTYVSRRLNVTECVYFVIVTMIDGSMTWNGQQTCVMDRNGRCRRHSSQNLPHRTRIQTGQTSKMMEAHDVDLLNSDDTNGAELGLLKIVNFYYRWKSIFSFSWSIKSDLNR